jgi:hypothetical protein
MATRRRQTTFTRTDIPLQEARTMPYGKFRVMRCQSFGAKPGVAANNLSEKEADSYIAACQESGDGFLYTKETDPDN